MTTHTAARVTGTQPRRIVVALSLHVEHEPHLLHAVEQVLTALQNAGVQPLDVQAYDAEEDQE